MFWTPQISPSSFLFYTGDKFPALKGNFVSALSGLQVQRIAFDQPGQPER